VYLHGIERRARGAEYQIVRYGQRVVDFEYGPAGGLVVDFESIGE
jgi:hypothetical protein